MGVGSERTRVSDLTFQVFDHALHPEWLANHAHRRIARTNWEADIRVLDGGHAIIWSSGETRLTEVLCPAEMPLPESGCVYQSNVRYERATNLQPEPSVEYHCCFESERVAPEVFMHLCAELTLDARRGGLLYRENPTNRMMTPQLCFITYEAKARTLAVQAVHTFPDERAIVRVQSLFERVAD